jgi:hypothetical protein
MDILQENRETKKTFISHVFSTKEEDKAEILNVVQYSVFGILPIVILNKLIQKFVPEADPEKSSLELLAEILIQLIIIFCGIVLIHRIIVYFPTYSGFKYENLALTNVILAFLVIVLSIQSKLGIKANILVDRVSDLWNGGSRDNDKSNVKKNLRVSQPLSHHNSSQADYLDNNAIQKNLYPPAPVSTTQSSDVFDYMSKMGGFGGGGGGKQQQQEHKSPGLMPANSLLGSSFGSAF